MSEATPGEFQTKATPQKPPSAMFRRWMLELDLSGKRERDWRKTSNDLWDKYRAANKKKNSFNILWANTDAMLPMLFNQPPKPDVRRRWRSADPLGKAVSEVLERGAAFSVDAEDFFDAAEDDVTDMLVCGRGLSRVRYVPSFKQVGVSSEDHEESEEQDSSEAYEGNGEELEFARVCIEHVNWDDFRHGAGRTWAEVPWVAFRVRVAKDEATEQFGAEIAERLVYDQVEDRDVVGRDDNKDLEHVFKTAELWEVWDKTDRKCFFIHPGYKEGPIYPKPVPSPDGKTLEQGEPPLKFKGFFPIPRPLRAVKDSSSTLPIPLYEEYREQAEELDRISGRINKLINGLKLRGIYDATITEFDELLKGQDNDLTPSESATRVMAMGGDLNKAIAWMPIEMAARVLKELYFAREQCKQTIYEISGMSDILRAQTDPNETLGAQQMKANFASMRMQRLRKEVGRYMRDQVRLMCEVIGECFDIETLRQMTGLNFPMAADKAAAAQILAQAQQSQMMAQQGIQGPQVDPAKVQQAQQVMQMPSWEDIQQVLKSDYAREFRVDIETDSTVAETLQADMQGLRDVLTGVVQFWQGAGPAVMSGAVDMSAIKAITLQICRRAKLGLEVEDALETGMKQPNPPQPKEEAKTDPMEAQVAQIKGQAEIEKANAELKRIQLEAERDAQKHQFEMEYLGAQHMSRMQQLTAPRKAETVQ